jgi:hypothetical protein
VDGTDPSGVPEANLAAARLIVNDHMPPGWPATRTRRNATLSAGSLTTRHTAVNPPGLQAMAAGGPVRQADLEHPGCRPGSDGHGGLDPICARASQALEAVPGTAVLAGFSMGTGVIGSLWDQRRAAVGIVLLRGIAAFRPVSGPGCRPRCTWPKPTRSLPAGPSTGGRPTPTARAWPTTTPHRRPRPGSASSHPVPPCKGCVSTHPQVWPQLKINTRTLRHSPAHDGTAAKIAT